MSGFTESVVEDAALAWRKARGFAIKRGLEIAAGEAAAERSDPGHRDVVVEQRQHGELRPKGAFWELQVLRAGKLSGKAT